MRNRMTVGFSIGMFIVAVARAETPLGTTFTYQGQLKNAGSPAGGSFNMVFQLFDALTVGNQVGPTLTFNGIGGNPPPVAVTDGLFTVPLDFGSTVFGGNKRWLSIAVNGATLAPRQELTAAPNALNADKLDGLNSTAFLQSVPLPLTLSGLSTMHIIRGENASSSFISSGVFGVSTAASGTTSGVHGHSSSTAGRGVYGSADAASGVNSGGYFESESASGRGVFGLGSADAGTNYGGRFESNSVSGYGVYGRANASTGITFGVYGQTNSPDGFGVRGNSTSATGNTYGGKFESASPDGGAVFGETTAVSGPTFGGRFECNSPQGKGVYGVAFAESGTTFGVYAVSVSPFGRGVEGRAEAVNGSNVGVNGVSNSTSGRGVVGLAQAGFGTTYGVYGTANTSGPGYAIFANGDLGAGGVKSFRIDHPDDPARKYLLHYAAESPEVINFYRGNVMLDDAGEALVELPHYFAKVNKAPSYQLTAVGTPMPMLHVAEKISVSALSIGANAGPDDVAPLCSFRIAGGSPGGEVSWEVKAVRNDRWVQKRGAPVEVEKQDLERDTYQHPELYGQPPEKDMNYRVQCTLPALHDEMPR